jgi:hypothetical protein
MADDRLDLLSHTLAAGDSRRGLLARLGTSVVAALAVIHGEEAAARRRRRKRKKRPKSKPCGAGGLCRVFVSSTVFGGNLSGLTGADSICQDLAEAAGLPGVYKAWLSDSTASPSTRFVRSTGPYRLVNGTKIADNWTDLTNGSLDAPINRTQAGNAVGDSNLVWTHTQTDGSALDGANHCGNWATATGDGDVGTDAASDATWTVNGFAACNTGHHLYCFQQS